jgi:hypothetical protein
MSPPHFLSRQKQCSIPAEEQALFHNEIELQDPKSTLEGNNVAPDDILTLRRRIKKPRMTNIATVGAGAGSGPAVRPGQIARGGGDPHDAEQIRQHILSNPSVLRQLQGVKKELSKKSSFYHSSEKRSKNNDRGIGKESQDAIPRLSDRKCFFYSTR